MRASNNNLYPRAQQRDLSDDENNSVELPPGTPPAEPEPDVAPDLLGAGAAEVGGAQAPGNTAETFEWELGEFADYADVQAPYVEPAWSSHPLYSADTFNHHLERATSPSFPFGAPLDVQPHGQGAFKRARSEEWGDEGHDSQRPKRDDANAEMPPVLDLDLGDTELGAPAVHPAAREARAGDVQMMVAVDDLDEAVFGEDSGYLSDTPSESDDQDGVGRTITLVERLYVGDASVGEAVGGDVADTHSPRRGEALFRVFPPLLQAAKSCDPDVLNAAVKAERSRLGDVFDVNLTWRDVNGRQQSALTVLVLFGGAEPGFAVCLDLLCHHGAGAPSRAMVESWEVLHEQDQHDPVTQALPFLAGKFPELPRECPMPFVHRLSRMLEKAANTSDFDALIHAYLTAGVPIDVSARAFYTTKPATPLQVTAATWNPELMRSILGVAGTGKVDFSSSKGQGTLNAALRELLHINWLSNEENRTGTTDEELEGRLIECFELLIEAGAHPAAKDRKGLSFFDRMESLVSGDDADDVIVGVVARAANRLREIWAEAASKRAGSDANATDPDTN